MTDSWQWTDAARERHFSPALLGRYPLERTDESSYWELHERQFRPHFPPEVYFDFEALRSPAAREARGRLMESEGAAPLREWWLVRDGDRVVAMFCGNQWRGACFEMHHSVVHPDHRRRGIYRAIIDLQLAYSAELGFDTVISDHAPGNNPVLIAKLRAGFRILGLELNAAVGPSLRLIYFHNPDHLAAYEYRMGNASINPRLVESGLGAIDLLREQFRA